jgi:hypothetical protein
MRAERHGGPPDLQAVFKSFVVEKLGGCVLDDSWDQESAAGKFPDFTCFRGLLLIEMKHLEARQSDRLNEVLRQQIDPAEMPFFYGARDANLILKSISNREAVSAAIMAKLSRTVEGLLSRANGQFSDYRSRHPRKNSITICAILNSTVREFTPDVVLKAVHSKMMDRIGRQRFLWIDAVLYISEKHYQRLPDGRTAFPIGVFECATLLENHWKVSIVDHVVRRWSEARTGTTVLEAHNLDGFEAIHDIPDVMKRHEIWRLEYERTPYLRSVPIEKLRMLFQRSIAINSLALLKGSWPKPSKKTTSEGLRQFTHVIEETNRRGIDIRSLDSRLLSPTDKAQVYAGLPAELVSTLDPESA